MRLSLFHIRASRLAGLVLTAMLLLAAACGEGVTTPGSARPPTRPAPRPEPAPVAAVEISPGAVTLELDDTRQLDVTLRAADGSRLLGRAIAWESSDEAVVRVSAAGLIRAQGEGTAVVSASSGGKRGAVQVMVVLPKPVPVLSAISPASVIAEGPDFTLTLTGSGFTPGAWVWINGSPIIATFVSETELRVPVGSNHIMQPGELSIRVLNLPPGGGQSAVLPLTVVPHPDARPVPGLVSVSPVLLVAGSGEQVLTLHGGGFVPESIVLINGRERSTEFVDATTLRARLAAEDVARVRDLYVQVRTRGPGGGGSGVVTVQVRPASGT